VKRVRIELHLPEDITTTRFDTLLSNARCAMHRNWVSDEKQEGNEIKLGGDDTVYGWWGLDTLPAFEMPVEARLAAANRIIKSLEEYGARQKDRADKAEVRLKTVYAETKKMWKAE
jgi:hypothetical protein